MRDGEFERTSGRSQVDGCPACHCDREQQAGFAPGKASATFVGGVPAEDADETHVEEICAQRHDSPVLKKEALHDENEGNDQRRAIRPEKDCREYPTEQMTRSSANDWKVYELADKNKRGQHAVQRRRSFVPILPHFSKSKRKAASRQCEGRGACLGVQKTVRYVHAVSLREELRIGKPRGFSGSLQSHKPPDMTAGLLPTRVAVWIFKSTTSPEKSLKSTGMLTEIGRPISCCAPGRVNCGRIA